MIGATPKSAVGGPDAGVSEVVGSILMVAITVAVAAGMISVLYGAVTGDEPPLRASLTGSIQANEGGWGSGDETVTVSHKGGHSLGVDSLTILVEVSGEETRYTPDGANPLDHAQQTAFGGQDEAFTIGERWASTNLTIPTQTRVAVTVVDATAGNVLWSASFRTGPGDCDTDTQPPSVDSFLQTPSDVDTDTSGPVTVEATLEDDCGVDTTTDPHLHYRVNDGSDPSFTDAGAMTLQTGTTWEGSIPDQAWGDHGGDTLEYKLVAMTDEEGNAGESSLQQDTIQTTGSNSYVQTPLAMVTGTASNDDAARSASDGDAAATLTEASTDSSSTTREEYGTDSTGTATDPSNAEGAPDDTYATMDANGEDVEISGFPADSGQITTVEIALEGKHDGGRDTGLTDEIRLSHDQGPTEQTYPLTTSDTQRFLDVTSDRSWSWTDIQNLGVQATCECRDTGVDEKVFTIDALWVRVTTSTDVYELETDAWTFDPLGSGSTHTLEIRYKTNTAEAYQVQIWDGSTWTVQSPVLDQGSFTVFSEPLTSSEVSAGPEIRILDQGQDDGTQGSIDIDYARVVSS